MLKRSRRLSRTSLTEALTTGKRRSSAHFSVVIPISVQGYAVIVPKKVARLSVTRHRIKRRVFAILRELPKPRSAIIFPRASIIDMEYDGAKRELQKILS